HTEYLQWLRRCRASDTRRQDCELTIVTGNGERQVQLMCRPRRRTDGSPHEDFVSVIDVSDRSRIERERERIAREHGALASRLISIQDAERLRIARNLHDDIGQQVTALRLRLEELAGAVPDEMTRAALSRVEEMTKSLDERLHFVASELRPSVLDLGIV